MHSRHFIHRCDCPNERTAETGDWNNRKIRIDDRTINFYRGEKPPNHFRNNRYSLDAHAAALASTQFILVRIGCRFKSDAIFICAFAGEFYYVRLMQRGRDWKRRKGFEIASIFRLGSTAGEQSRSRKRAVASTHSASEQTRCAALPLARPSSHISSQSCSVRHIVRVGFRVSDSYNFNFLFSIWSFVLVGTKSGDIAARVL